jgi:hypothetical protein
VNTAILVIELLAKYGPSVAETAQRILSGKEPTEADWKELFSRARKPYDRYIQEADERAKTP